jgi:hypothetical protein
VSFIEFVEVSITQRNKMDNNANTHQSIMEQDGFTIHKSKSKTQHHINKKNTAPTTRERTTFKYKTTSTAVNDETRFNSLIDKFHSKVSDYVNQLQDHSFLTEIQKYISTLHSSNIHFVCYGIGDILNSSIAQLQFACYLLVKQYLEESYTIETCLMYDPVVTMNYSSEECDQIIQMLQSKYNIVWPLENNECKHVCETDTLFFMPHGSRQMYYNVIYANLKQLNKLCIIGNSFSSYSLRSPSILFDQFNHEHSLASTLRVKKRNDSFQQLLFQSFNDTSVHSSDRDTSDLELSEQVLDDVELIRKDKTKDNNNNNTIENKD